MLDQRDKLGKAAQSADTPTLPCHLQIVHIGGGTNREGGLNMQSDCMSLHMLWHLVRPSLPRARVPEHENARLYLRVVVELLALLQRVCRVELRVAWSYHTRAGARPLTDPCRVLRLLCPQLSCLSQRVRVTFVAIICLDRSSVRVWRLLFLKRKGQCAGLFDKARIDEYTAFGLRKRKRKRETCMATHIDII
jgi:hypothetical protein